MLCIRSKPYDDLIRYFYYSTAGPSGNPSPDWPGVPVAWLRIISPYEENFAVEGFLPEPGVLGIDQ